jgi:uncharacterized membrane protein
MSTVHQSIDSFPVRHVPVSRPFIWLSEGWSDLMHHRSASIAYGVLVTGLGALILAYGRHPVFVAATWVGFLLVGPLFTAGLCELSRCRDEGEMADFQSSLRPLRLHRASLLGVAETLALLAVVWFALSAAAYLGMGHEIAPSLTALLWGDFMAQVSQTQMITYFMLGLILSAAVFALSVVTVPMIVERHVDAATAMRMSLRVTARDFPAMLLWAVLIAALVAIGFLTGLFAMVVIFPLLGHATWHAYKELVE